MQDHLNREQITRYCNRQILPEELGLLDEHIAECADCRERLFSAARLREALQRAPSGEPSSSGHKLTTASQQTPREHISYEQLEAFVDEKSIPSEMHLVRLHVTACRQCAGELDDLRTFKSELSHRPTVVEKSKKSWWDARLAPMFTPRPIFVAALSAAVVLLAVMGINKLRSPHSPNTLETANSHSINSNSSALQASEGSISGSATVLALTAEEQKQVLQAFAQWENVIPASLSEVQGNRQTLLGKSNLAPALEVVQPVGEVVWEVRPVFRWKPISRAVNYSVAIFDAKLNPVQKSGKLQDVKWEPSRELKRGQVYQWQVTAHLQDGSSLNAPAPPQPEARFRVLDRQKEEELSRFASAHAEAHLALGILDGQAGLLSKAEQQLRQISETDADYQLAQSLLKRIQEIRSSTN
jgi:hypothetical protein